MESMVEFVHERIKGEYQVGVDFTMGNGFDTVFLSQCCKEVHSYDIQQQALDSTSLKVKDFNHVHLYLKSHEYFDEDVSSFDIGIFNLGYLPGGNHEYTTTYQTTLKTLEKAINLLNPQGYLYVVVYIGHDQGKEASYLNEYFSRLDSKRYNVARFEMMNKHNAPYVIMIEKRK